MVNLILNAIQASPEGCQVEVGVETQRNACGSSLTALSQAQPNYLVAWVEDQGPGLTPEEREQVFDPFYSTKPDGTGLGLAISYEIVTRHGGYITLESQSGCTRFSVFLPISNT